MIVRLVYADGQKEDHRLVNGEHVADYIRRVDVPQSAWAFDLGGRQVRFVSVRPQRPEPPQRLMHLKRLASPVGAGRDADRKSVV